jgi:pyrimidine-specific ribonucleoside hydrolase
MILAIFNWGNALGHSGNPKYHVIIDTDGALDDMRAISMLLSDNDIRVLAICSSQGTLVPDSVFVKVHSLLATFHHEGIPVGISDKVNAALPPWSDFASGLAWGNPISPSQLDFHAPSIEVLNDATQNYPSKVILIALGSLKTYADWIRVNPGIADKIERIVWYNPHDIKEGFNYMISPESYEYIRQTGISLEIVHDSQDDLPVNQDYLDHIHNDRSMYASQIEYVHLLPPVMERINQHHLHLWDDLIPLYLTVSIIFEAESDENLKYISLKRPLPPGFVYETIGKLLGSASVAGNRVFNGFPMDSSIYKAAYADILQETIRKFGEIEWKAICMTNEIHGHTGIYSIIGAKMGIRAMEYFNVGVNNLEVVTFAGNTPPLSCFNDGLQISSGATIGQGLITVSDSISPIPSALFRFNGQKVHIELDPGIAEQMRRDIGLGIEKFGLQSDKYWLYIEQLAIRYWADFDRQQIFTVR